MKAKIKVDLGVNVNYQPDKTPDEIRKEARLHNEKVFGKQPKELIK